MKEIAHIWNTVGQFEILENDLHNIILFSVILSLGLIFKRFISVRSSRFAYLFIRKLSSNMPTMDFVNLLKPPVELFITLLMIYVAFGFLHYPESWHLASARRFGLKLIVNKGYQFVLFLSVVWIVFRMVDFCALVLQKNASEKESKIQEQLVPFLTQLVKIILAGFFFFAILGVVFNLNVGAIITGLGIGGVAVALAGKETLENLLASFTIFVDKPFIIGDLIKVGDITGNVEAVGFRTSRIRTLDKSLISIPNKQLVDLPLENLSHRHFHRAKFDIGVPFNTSVETLQLVVEKIKEEIKSHPLVENTVVYFDKFGTYTYDITVIYIVKVNEYEEFWQIKEALNYKIMQIVDGNGVDIEYPTSIVYVRNN